MRIPQELPLIGKRGRFSLISNWIARLDPVYIGRKIVSVRAYPKFILNRNLVRLAFRLTNVQAVS